MWAPTFGAIIPISIFNIWCTKIMKLCHCHCSVNELLDLVHTATATVHFLKIFSYVVVVTIWTPPLVTMTSIFDTIMICSFQAKYVTTRNLLRAISSLMLHQRGGAPPFKNAGLATSPYSLKRPSSQKHLAPK